MTRLLALPVLLVEDGAARRQLRQRQGAAVGTGAANAAAQLQVAAAAAAAAADRDEEEQQEEVEAQRLHAARCRGRRWVRRERRPGCGRWGRRGTGAA